MPSLDDTGGLVCGQTRIWQVEAGRGGESERRWGAAVDSAA